MNGSSVILVEPGAHLGGMTASGLSSTDTGVNQVITGLAADFYSRVGAKYGESTPEYYFEPHVAEEVFNDLVNEAGVQVLYGRRLKSVAISSAVIASIVVEDSTAPQSSTDQVIQAKVFIDATYTGDLMAAAGVPYVYGREANTVYGETYNGVQSATVNQFPDNISPYVTAGNPASGFLPGINAESLAANGSGDDKIQAYNYRLCMTKNSANRLPVPAPSSYDPMDYELLGRLFAQGYITDISKFLLVRPLKNQKYDVNNNGPVSTDNIGGSWTYFQADYNQRAVLADEHKNWVEGLFEFLNTDDRVPAAIRDEVQSWGLCADEFSDNGNWPYLLYTREARRLSGRYTVTEHDLFGQVHVSDGIAYGYYTLDSHCVQRVVVNDMVKNEGFLEFKLPGPYLISYRAITPSASNCSNLLIPAALSASHAAFCSIRVEPVFMALGQAAGAAASLAAKSNLAVQDVDVGVLQDSLGITSPVIVDNTDAGFTTVGTWPSSTYSPGYYGTDYQYAPPGSGGLSASWTSTLAASGQYKIYARWTSHTNRATNAPYTIYNNGTKVGSVSVNQRVNGGQFNLLTTLTLSSGTLRVQLNDVSTGYVVADAVEIVPVTSPVAPVAAFSATPVSGTAPLSVMFSDLSTGDIDSWAWDFDGDGVIDSTVKNPSHTYSKAGTYTVTLTVSGPGGSNTATKAGYITVAEGELAAAFSATPTSGFAPLAVTFTDLSIGPVTSWAWDFDSDGTVDATVQNPTHTYSSAGTYTVTLTVTAAGVSDTVVKTGYITVAESVPTVIVDNRDGSFSTVGTWLSSTYSPGYYGTDYQYASPGTGSMSAAWAFTVATAGQYQVYARWTSHSNRAPNAPYSIYNNGSKLGTYPVNQTINGGQFNLLTTLTLSAGTLKVQLNDIATGYVVADAVELVPVSAPSAPVAAFSGSPTSGAPPLTVNFTDQSTGTVTSWAWDFDNNGTTDSTAQNPTHIYSTAGTYTVKLTVSGPGGSNSITKSNYITVSQAAPVAAFSGSPTSGAPPLTVNFTDQSTGTVTSWAWDFDNNGTTDSTAQNPTHIYSTAGTYTVKLTVSGPGGANSITKSNYITVSQTVPTAAFSALPTDGNAPLTVNFTDQSTGTVTSWAWDFDNNGTTDSTVQNPSHTYTAPGTYSVKLTVSGSGGSNSLTRLDYITVRQGTAVIDNTDSGFTTVGTWPSSTSIAGFYGANYQYAPTGNGSMSATWSFSVSTPGEYAISAIWTAHSNRAPNAPYSIYNNGTKVATVYADQRVNGGQFNLLGTYSLSAGTVQVVLKTVSTGYVVADAVKLEEAAGVLTITSPANLALKTSQDVQIQSSVIGFPLSWTVQYILDGDLNNPLSAVACDPSSDQTACLDVVGLSLAEHTIDARMVNDGGAPQPYTDHVAFGVGDYYIGFGDSITRGSHDDILTDNTSSDQRNTGGGYEPILNNLLTAGQGYPHTVVNAGVSGDKSSDGLARIGTVLTANPDSQYVLIQFGTNDSSGSLPLPSGLGLDAGVVVDNGASGFSTVGTWPFSTATPGYYGSNYQYAAAGTGSMTARWSFQVASQGNYAVSARWTAASNRASDARYAIYNNGTLVGTVTKDQRVNGGQFNLLGTFSLNAGTVQIVLSDLASGYVIADAVQVGQSDYIGSYKYYLQQIITRVTQAGRIPLLAKVPYVLGVCGGVAFTDPDNAAQNVLIREYNEVIDELRTANGISTQAPDFYDFFRTNPDQIADNCHPNGVGYQSMAQLWKNILAP